MMPIRTLNVLIFFVILDVGNVIRCQQAVTTNANKEDISTAWVEPYLLTNQTLQFLDTFYDREQRNVVETQLRHCPFTSLCTFSLNHTKIAVFTCCKDCSCKANCDVTQSCCPDVMSNLYGNNTADVETNYNTGQVLECTLMHIRRKREKIFPDQASALLYTTCPQQTNGSLTALCTRVYYPGIKYFKDVVPVTEVGTRNVYRNRYCAQCRGIFESNMQFWVPMFRCKDGLIDLVSDEDYISKAFKDPQCDLSFYNDAPLNKQPRRCTTVTSRCNETGEWLNYDPKLERTCAAYESTIQVKKEYYRNVFCAFCNGLMSIMNNTKCVQTMSNAGDFSFSGLLSFDRNKVNTITKQEECNSTSFWDAHSKSCKYFYCTELILRPVNKSCEAPYYAVKNIIYTIFIRLRPANITRVGDAFDIAFSINQWVKTKLSMNTFVCSINILSKTNVSFKQNISKEELENAQLVFFDIRVKVGVSTIHDPKHFKKIVEKLEQDNVHLPCSKSSHKSNVAGVGGVRYGDDDSTKMCLYTAKIHDDLEILFDYVEQISRKNLSSSGFEVNSPVSFFLAMSFIMEDNDGFIIVPNIRRNDRDASCISPYKKIKFSSLQYCPMVNVLKTDFPWDDTASGIHFSKADLYVDSLDYHFVGGLEKQIRICLNIYTKLAESYITHGSLSLSTESIVSTVCVSVSILCLLYTFVTYCLFKELRTIPGKNNMTLTLSLMISLVLYLIGSKAGLEESSVSCKLVGLCTHFFWLLSVFWMNICTFHTFKVFVNSKRARSFDSSWKQECYYNMYAIIASSIFVLLNVVYSLYHVDTNGMGYGIVICYISSGRMQIFTFGIHIAVVICFNIVMFVMVMVKVKRMPFVTKSVKHERNDVVIFAKISTLTGIMWIFGFVYMWTHIVAFSYIFILLSGGQGLFIMLSFVFNKRVQRLYKGILPFAKPSNSTSTTTSELHAPPSKGTDQPSSGTSPLRPRYKIYEVTKF